MTHPTSLDQNFYALDPEEILTSVEKYLQARSTGRIQQLNSFENRVYEIEMEEDVPDADSGNKVVTKFYRPGRWTDEQILEEHGFLLKLKSLEIPCVAPLTTADGKTLLKSTSGIRYSVFPKVKGRRRDELDLETAATLGRTLARIHLVGEKFPFKHRLKFEPRRVIGDARKILEREDELLQGPMRARYLQMLDQIETWMAPDSWPKTGWISVHGDAHGGNLLWLDGKRPVFLDFDDAWTALAAQDLWLCEPSAADFPREKEAFQDAYDEIRPYPFEELGWIPRLRAMRMIHYAAWIANRWSDPAFPKAFAHFGTNEYWMREIEALSILMDPPAETYSHDSD